MIPIYLYHSRFHHSATIHFDTDGVFCTCQRVHDATVTLRGHHPDGRIAHLSQPNGRNRWTNLFVRRLQLQSSKRSASGWDILFSKVEIMGLPPIEYFSFLFFIYIDFAYFFFLSSFSLYSHSQWWFWCALHPRSTIADVCLVISTLRKLLRNGLANLLWTTDLILCWFLFLLLLFSFRCCFCWFCVFPLCCACRNQLQDGSRYDWSQKQQGIILSSFYWGYIITQLPGGVLAQRFGGKHVLTLGLFFTAICTMLTPLCVQYGKIASFGFSVFERRGCYLLHCLHLTENSMRIWMILSRASCERGTFLTTKTKFNIFEQKSVELLSIPTIMNSTDFHFCF